MTATAARLDSRRDYYRDYLDHGAHSVPSGVRRTLVDLLSASFIAQTHGDLRTAAARLAEVKRTAARHGLKFDR